MRTRDGVRITTRARERFGLPTSLLDPDERLPLATFSTARHVAERVTATRAAEGDVEAGPVIGGELAAYGLIDAILQRVIELYLEQVEPSALDSALAAAARALGPLPAERTLAMYDTTFPVRFDLEPEAATSRAAVLEELILTWLGNVNPAVAPFRELFDDRPLADVSPYPGFVGAVGTHFEALPPFGPEGLSLIALLRAPALASPDSLTGQLEYIRDRWSALLGDYLDRLLIALSVLADEQRALWMRMHPGTGGAAGATSAALGRFGGAAFEAEAFSEDRDWMPNVVLMAKSTYVWLDQLSRRYGREIRTLDAIPEEELDSLRSWGVNGLWLIGLWQRSRASERIKRMRGNPEAVASAYSLDEYRIADDLGGEAAWASLRERAWRRGLRLAADMVPNHMGIDSRWVIEHPERFLSLREPPYPSYGFGGPDLSDDPGVAIRIEDHYWDGMDAAVVFQRVDTATGDVRYIYHGNDGTSFPWNDTAQLDYLSADAREAVIRAIIDVARRFPIIRFDAAMTLAKKHIERLWFPVPGEGGAIPSRAEHAMTPAAFDAAMPQEFWREVVDRVAAEAPDTLLLAEAFWLMEGYFVRTLGMHRVYNSAFMHMLRDEDNAGYRSVMKNTLEFDPEVLKRYVNFMNNPDERTAVEQFGKGDKYFGIATLLATLPGLPMLGHGQVEGFGEKYGMEYRRAYLDERPDQWLVERHERELFPLLHRRRQFADVRDFLLFDLYREDGSVDEDVFAYSNGSGGGRSLVVYQNRFGSTAGWIRESAARSVPGEAGRRLVRRTLADGWGLPNEADVLVRFRDHVSGLEHLHRATSIHERGLFVALDAYGRHVFLDVAEVRDGAAGLWGRLADHLAGRGVPSLEAALRELELEPVHAAFRRVFDDGVLAGLVSPGPPAGAAGRQAPVLGEPAVPMGSADAALEDLTRRLSRFLTAVAESTGTDGPAAGAAETARSRLEAVLALAERGPASAVGRAWADPVSRAALVGWALLSPMGALTRTPAAATTRAWFGDLRLAAVVAQGSRSLGLDEGAAWAAAERIPVLITLPLPSDGPVDPDRAPGTLVAAWLADTAIRPLIGVNRWEGVEWFAKEPFESLLDLAAALEAVRSAGTEARATAIIDRLRSIADEAGYRVDSLVELTGAVMASAGASATDRPASGDSGPGMEPGSEPGVLESGGSGPRDSEPGGSEPGDDPPAR
jgi:glycosidase